MSKKRLCSTGAIKQKQHKTISDKQLTISNMNKPDQEDFIEYEDDRDSYEDDDEICGYHCLCCNSTFGTDECDGDDCPRCMSNALDEIYF